MKRFLVTEKLLSIVAEKLFSISIEEFAAGFQDTDIAVEELPPNARVLTRADVIKAAQRHLTKMCAIDVADELFSEEDDESNACI